MLSPRFNPADLCQALHGSLEAGPPPEYQPRARRGEEGGVAGSSRGSGRGSDSGSGSGLPERMHWAVSDRELLPGADPLALPNYEEMLQGQDRGIGVAALVAEAAALSTMLRKAADI